MRYIIALSLFVLGSLWVTQDRPPVVIATAPQQEIKVIELAPKMAELQRLSFKLGRAVEAKNRPLVNFYLEELDESASRIARDIRYYEGHSIGELIKAKLLPALRAVEPAIDSGDWDRTTTSYKAMIAACNSCHQATKHAFVEIVAAEGEYLNQKFSGNTSGGAPLH